MPAVPFLFLFLLSTPAIADPIERLRQSPTLSQWDGTFLPDEASPHAASGRILEALRDAFGHLEELALVVGLAQRMDGTVPVYFFARFHGMTSLHTFGWAPVRNGAVDEWMQRDGAGAVRAALLEYGFPSRPGGQPSCPHVVGGSAGTAATPAPPASPQAPRP